MSGDALTLLLQFGSIPIVAALIGYGTNVLAIQMTFLPLEYIGCFEKLYRQIGFSCGWQVGSTHVRVGNRSEARAHVYTRRVARGMRYVPTGCALAMTEQPCP